MNDSPQTSAAEKQLELRPVMNQAARVEPIESGGCRIFMPFRKDGWRKMVSFMFRFPEEKSFELDDMGAEILGWCDGKTVFGTMIERYMQRWKLSFLEARGMLMIFFRPLLRNNIVIFVD